MNAEKHIYTGACIDYEDGLVKFRKSKRYQGQTVVDDVTVNIVSMWCGYLAISANVSRQDVMTTILSPLLCPTAFDPPIPVILMEDSVLEGSCQACHGHCLMTSRFCMIFLSDEIPIFSRPIERHQLRWFSVQWDKKRSLDILNGDWMSSSLLMPGVRTS